MRFRLLFLLLANLASGQTCAPCHPAQAEEQNKTPHAASLRRVDTLAQFASTRAEWAFGAGSQAITFVTQVDRDHYLEQGLSWYKATNKMELTPGHKSAKGVNYRTFSPGSEILRCFQCHSTGALTMDDNFRIQPAELGVRCQACHGAGTGHPQRMDAVRNPAKFNAEEINQLCGACHRMPAAAGDNTDWSNPWNTRHQPLYLAESRCFLQSKGKLSCTTCHSPHSAQSVDYDVKCKSCHAQPKHKAAVSGTCINCHMPAVKPQHNLKFSNHWIGVYATGNVLRPRR